MIVAHRGASRDAPENTIPAFKLAWEQGADAIEGDFRLTKDGHIVCIHDDNTKRVSNADRVVSNTTLAELRQLDVGAYRGKEFQDTRIPTIAEVFQTIPKDKRIYIEIKCGTEIIPTLLEEIKHADLTAEQVLVIGFDEEVIRELKARAPQYSASWLCSFRKSYLGRISPSLDQVLATLARIKADGLSSNVVIPKPFVEAVEKQGYAWHAWTVDDLKTARRLKALGVSSITSNVPGYMQDLLRQQGDG